MPYIFVGPDSPYTIGEIANQVFEEHYRALGRALQRRNVAVLGRLLVAGDTPWHGELLSYVFFAPEFAERLIRQGEADARSWLAVTHDDGLWQLGRRSAT